MQWTGWALLALGVWLIVAPFALGYSAIDAAVINDGAFGVLIAGLAAYSMVAPRRVAEAFMMLATAAGLWVASAPFLLGYTVWQGPDLGQGAVPFVADYPVPAIVNDLVVGFSVVILGLMRAVTFRERRRA
jgi:SPW repeat-containing protein